MSATVGCWAFRLRDLDLRHEAPEPARSAALQRVVGVAGDDVHPLRREGMAALKSIRAARPDSAAIYVILDNLSAHTGADIRRWVKRKEVELCFTPAYASWANAIEAHFGPLRQFTLANSNHRSHSAQTRSLHRYLRWRNTNARHPDVLAAQRKERARIRSEKGIRWGGRPLAGAA